MSEIPGELRMELRQYGQEHILAAWPSLDENQRHRLLTQLRQVNLAQVRELWHGQAGKPDLLLPPLEKIRPVQPVALGPEYPARGLGEQALRRGDVAVLVVAGGQGSRLGADCPKGMFPVGPITGKTLFQIHAEKVLALRRRYRTDIPFLVMTSPATDQPTRGFFAEKNFFGLPAAEVHFFCQGTMPAVDIATGRLLLSAPDCLCLSPNGHGGVLAALRDSGLLGRLQEDGIRQLFYFQVDNPLVKIAEPVFLGHHLAEQAEVSVKVLPKANSEDKLGNLVEVDGRCLIIEYFHLPKSMAEARDQHGRLRFGMGSPAIHVFDIGFLSRVLEDKTSLPLHAARKKVPCLDESGQRTEPKVENALKFEMFIFDVFPHAQRWAAVLTDRAEEFAPLKNDTGLDSPVTVRQAISEQAADWLRKAGAWFPAGETPDLEISPLLALDAEELKTKIKAGLQIEGRTYLE